MLYNSISRSSVMYMYVLVHILYRILTTQLFMHPYSVYANLGQWIRMSWHFLQKQIDHNEQQSHNREGFLRSYASHESSFRVQLSPPYYI